MSKKRMRSSPDDWLKEEHLRRGAGCQRGGCVAARRGHEEIENLEEQAGNAAEDEAHAG